MPRDGKGEVGFAELHIQLRIISRLMAAQLKATTGQQELVRLLSTTGASHAEIADVLDTTPATVTTTIQRLRRRAKPKVKDAADSEGDVAGSDAGGVSEE